MDEIFESKNIDLEILEASSKKTELERRNQESSKESTDYSAESNYFNDSLEIEI